MVEINKQLDEWDNYKFKIKTDKGTIEIDWGGDLDLYLRIIPDQNRNDSYVIDITKEKYFLYRLFDEVYDAIISCDPYKYSYEDKIYNPFDKKTDSINYDAIRSQEYLLNDDIITWISDDGMKEDGARISIKKCDDKYELTFKRGYSDGRLTYSIRFRNSGSRYMPFNSTFGIMYDKLKYYDKDVDMQIHIEEYIYKQKHLTKPKV